MSVPIYSLIFNLSVKYFLNNLIYLSFFINQGRINVFSVNPQTIIVELNIFQNVLSKYVWGPIH